LAVIPVTGSRSAAALDGGRVVFCRESGWLTCRDNSSKNASETAACSLKFEAYCPAALADKDRLMLNRKAPSPQLDSGHCRAICEEVGERLRILLDKQSTEIPPRLRLLLDRLAELDSRQAPSIAPAMDDMTAWSAAA
jgi:hypothetical protein